MRPIACSAKASQHNSSTCSTASSRLGAAVKGLAIEAFTPFVGVVTNAVGEMTQLAEAFSNSIKNGGALSVLLDGVAARDARCC